MNSNISLSVYKPISCNSSVIPINTNDTFDLTSGDISNLELPTGLFSYATTYNFAIKVEKCANFSNGSLNRCVAERGAKKFTTGNFWFIFYYLNI